jgi:hypothetical protein
MLQQMYMVTEKREQKEREGEEEGRGREERNTSGGIS